VPETFPCADQLGEQQRPADASGRGADRVKNEIASALVSIGNTSLTVRYAALAPADAKNSATNQQAVIVTALSAPMSNRPPPAIPGDKRAG
jgi:hypothetical protein